MGQWVKVLSGQAQDTQTWKEPLGNINNLKEENVSPAMSGHARPQMIKWKIKKRNYTLNEN